ncbi:hypothetical protein ASC97_31895 [Rhizobium sp. Root1203]|uniref:serine hydrolase domain-containing protein n=1 Tax=Rhizobium sp. Root1203 TaxID=1736427 RepID=UPI00070A6A9B|nr:hypothetical protein ASC97_31895 [Rhizobium sp. Root1203]
MRRDSIPGVALAVVNDAEVVWKGGFGVSGIDCPLPVTSSTLFQAGSISKPVFAIAVMCLVEAGLLDLDEDVNSYLTSWKVPANGAWQPRITLRQLLSHSAATSVKGFPGYPSAGPRPTLLEVLNGRWPANSLPIAVEGIPGLTCRYSGGGTTIAQQVIMDVLGRPFPELMKELVLDPLGMVTSTYDQPLSADKAASAARGHRWNADPVSGGAYIYPEMAAAGLWTSAEELAELGARLIRLLQGGPSRLSLKKQNLEAMLRPQLTGEEIGQSFAGIGWFCEGKGDAFSFGHNGEDNGFLSRIRLFPEVGAGAAVLVNSIQGGPLISHIFSALAREFDWPSAHENLSAVVPLDYDNFVGNYTDRNGISAQITGEDGTLNLEIGSQPPMSLTLVGYRLFSSRVADMQVAFEELDKSGRFSLVLIQFGVRVVLQPAL